MVKVVVDDAGLEFYDSESKNYIKNEIAKVRRYCMVGSNNANTAGWYKVASQTMIDYSNTNITFMLTTTYSKYYSGILELQVRSDVSKLSCKALSWHTRIGYNEDDVICVIEDNTYTIYVNHPVARYGRTVFEIISESTTTTSSSPIELYNTSTPETETPVATIISSDGSTVNLSNYSNHLNQISLTTEDIDDILPDTSTIYLASNNNSVVNNPFYTGEAFSLFTYNVSNNIKVQEATSYDGIKKIRYYSNSWSDWSEIAYSENVLSLNGGKLLLDDLDDLVFHNNSDKIVGHIYSNSNGILGGIGMDISDGGLKRITSDLSKTYTILDENNYINYITPANIGAIQENPFCSANIGVGSGQKGYVAFAQITITGTYANRPIEFELSCRGKKTVCYVNICFANSGANDPDVKYLLYSGSDYGVFAYKIDTSNWLLYYTKSEAYDTVTLLKTSQPKQNISISYPSSFIAETDKPSDIVEATLGGDVLFSENSNNANTVNGHTVNSNVPSDILFVPNNGENNQILSWVDNSLKWINAEQTTGDYVPLSGGTMTGALSVTNVRPVSALSNNLGTTANPFLTLFINTIALRGDTSSTTYGGINVATVGTTDKNGSTKLVLGNNIASGTTNNSSGTIDVYGTNSKKTTITPSDVSSNITLTLPASTGTLALTSDIPNVNDRIKHTTFTNETSSVKQVKITVSGSIYKVSTYGYICSPLKLCATRAGVSSSSATSGGINILKTVSFAGSSDITYIDDVKLCSFSSCNWTTSPSAPGIYDDKFVLTSYVGAYGCLWIEHSDAYTIDIESV